MKKQILVLIPLLLILDIKIEFAQGLKMQVELDNPMKLYSFIQPHSVFISEGESFSLFDLQSGKKTYTLKVEDYQEKGLLKVLGDKLFVSSQKNLNCYDVSTGQLLWSKVYHDIDQENFSQLTKVDNTLLLRYGDVLLAIEIESGNELWYQNIKLNAQLNTNLLVLNEKKKFMALLEDDKVGLYDCSTGKQLLDTKDFEISSKVREKSYPWMYITKDEQYGVFLLDGHVAVLDFAANKVVSRVEISYDSDFPPILPLSKGCLILSKSKLVFINNQNGNLSEVPAPVSDFRTYDVMTVGMKEILLAGFKNSLCAVDLAAGTILWQSKKDDPNFEGFAHKYVKVEGNNILFTFNNTGLSIGTDLFLMSVDAFTGKVNYKVPVANCKQAIMGFQRMMSKASSQIDGTRNNFGYDNIGFNYSSLDHNGNLVFAIVSPYGMRLPEKRTDAGEGICVLEPKTGKILFSDYVELSEETSAQRTPGDYWVRPPFINDNNIILVGDRSIAVWDLSTLKRSWFSQKTIKSNPMDAAVIDNVLYIKFGIRAMNVNLSKDAGGLFDDYGMNIEESWCEQPFGFSAYDMNNGALLWSTETIEDPGFLSTKFSLKNDYDPTSKRLYFADEENLYALQLHKEGGKYDWIYKFAASDVGSIPLKQIYAIKEFPIGEVNVGYSAIGTATYRSETTNIGGSEYQNFQEEIADAYDYLTYTSGYTVWGVAAKKCLGFSPKGKNILLLANKGIAVIEGASGKTIWKNDWSYNQDNVQFLPKVMEDKLIYCVDQQLKSISITDGSIRFQIKESKRPHFILSPDNKYLVSIDEEGKVIKGYEL